LRIGLIDGGVDDTTPALSRARIERHGCEGVAHAQPHGTTVAGRLFDGRAGVLYAADLWCGERVGRGTLGIIEALDWMSRERVPVINISLVGPDNPLLRRAVARSIARGHVLVAAAGNDGPAAPALFPAAYPDVIGVAAVDGRMRVLPESASGPQVDFCAQGTVDARRRGTSFAAPVVARTAAGFGIASATGATAAVYARLKAASRDVGAPGRDPRCGEGFLSGR
jgi:subtilisin family serine protease